MKRSNDKRRTVKEIKDGILNHYGTIEKNPSKVGKTWRRKPYEAGVKKE
jgi:hypothetical protein